MMLFAHFFLLLCLFSSQMVLAVTSSDLFQKFPNKYFVESGSYCGNGIQMALNCGFEEILSIELADHHYQMCCARFAGNPHVLLFKGDSTEVLPLLLRRIDAPATFWLDGHYSEGSTAKGSTYTPILAELESIAKHPIKTHTILIDDIRQCGTVDFDFISLDMLIQKILEINPNYEISYADGFVSNDILVAHVRN